MIIDRVKKRYETDLDDDEIQLVIDEANQSVIDKFGPHANPLKPITERFRGYSKTIVLSRQIDVNEFVLITERNTYEGWGDEIVILDATDYRINPDLYTIERLITGLNARSRWGSDIDVTYTPVNDGNAREEVIIKLTILSLRYEGGFAGLGSKRVGDVSLSEADYRSQREALLNSLMPHGGLYMQ